MENYIILTSDIYVSPNNKFFIKLNYGISHGGFISLTGSGCSCIDTVAKKGKNTFYLPIRFNPHFNIWDIPPSNRGTSGVHKTLIITEKLFSKQAKKLTGRIKLVMNIKDRNNINNNTTLMELLKIGGKTVSSNKLNLLDLPDNFINLVDSYEVYYYL